MGFTHLHVHTQYSLLDGAAKIDKLIARAKELGQTALAITDHGNMFGVKEFHNIATKQGIKPILGCEVYVAHRSRFEKESKANRGGYHLVLLAKNIVGYHNLIKLVSYGWIEGYYYNPRIDKDILKQYSEGLICSSACLGGEISQQIMRDDLSGAKESIEWFKSVFGDDYYLEMQSHQSGNAEIDSKVYTNQMEVNKQIIELSKQTGVKYICTNDVHFIMEQDAPAHDRLICLSTGRDLEDPSRMRYTTQEYLKSEEQMAELFKDYPEALANTLEITDKIEEYVLNKKAIMPNFKLPDDFNLDIDKLKSSMSGSVNRSEQSELSAEHNTILNKIKDATNIDTLRHYDQEFTTAAQQQYLEYLTYRGAGNRWGNDLSDAIKERLDFELKTIEWMGYPGYFLIVWDFIKASRAQGVSVGPGRGSAAGSAVAYTLSITNIDPIKYDLLFERFLNPERVSLPDVDIDFDDEGRDKALKYVVNTYGKNKVAHITTFGTMAAKSSIRDVARIHKLPLSESNRLAKLVPDRPGVTLEIAYKESKELAQERSSDNPLISETLKYAEMLEGTVRNTGVHACGIIIGKEDLMNYVPLCTAKDTELLVVQYEGSLVEDIGLLKMDFLGLKTLSVIKDAVENVKISQGIDIDIDNIPLDDKKTFQLYSKGETTGLFQFESPGMKKHLKNLEPNRFEDLIAMNALYRPGPMEYIPDFIDRKHGRKPIVYDLPVMDKYLSDTYGITVYQEQVMLLSQLLANFTKGEADTLRKAMGKKQRAVLDKMKPKFIAGAEKNGHPIAICEKIWKDWEAFASYAFNKSHATCYAYISYQTAYLKAHYPAEFMSALLSRNLSSFDKLALFMDECKRMGSPLLGPDVNQSRGRFAVDSDGNIRFGMCGIKGLGENAVNAIVAEREANGKFKDIYDFVERLPLNIVNKKNMECLAYAGAFDTIFSEPRSRLIDKDDRDVNLIEYLIRYGQHIQNERDDAQNSLFGDMGSELITHKPTSSNNIEPWGKLEMLNYEKEYIGIYLSAHPLDDFRIVLDKFCSNKVADINNLESLRGREITIGGMVISSKHLTTVKGKAYGRFVIEDFSGNYEFTLFGRDWENYRIYCLPQASIMIRARVQEHRFRSGELELSIASMQTLLEVLENGIKQLTINLPLEDITMDIMGSLSELVSTHSGNAKLVFNILDRESGVYVQCFSRSSRVEINNSLIKYLEDYGLGYTIN